ncbi:homoserine kinase [Evansella tamaricis]|uniref:Homoserine kinase n=1 Tax=Evansella tamaricis TaxID=2069301 RepID=A0ABS6JKR9_9BACI|nr:homoserine kinase [Evansella tamaricis]MBU9713799.1 homoserine kinase [Evansella tamaricis]
MKNKYLFSITVPGSTANLGPGFDSVGLAVNRYLTLHVKTSDKWSFLPESTNLTGIPTDKTNLVYVVAESVAREFDLDLPPCEISMISDIPLSRGFGSSAAAIVAGIELANQLLELDLSPEKKVRLASLLEGHPDNVAASVYGGLVIGNHREDATDVILGGTPEFDMVAVIPDYELKTKESRSLLPDTLTFKESVKGSAISNVLVAALLQKQWDVMGKMMMKDLFHQPYREEVIPELKKALSIASKLGIYGVTLSGAGPIILFFAPIGEGKTIRRELQVYYSEYAIELIKVDKKGVCIDAGMTPTNMKSVGAGARQ